MGPWAALPLLTKIGIITGGAKAGGGILQAALSGEKKAQKKLESEIEGIQFPSILDYYSEAKRRYGVAPEQSALYKRQMQNIGRLQAGGLRKLQQSGNVLAGVPGILDMGARSSLDAAIAAEEERNRRFGQYGSAAQMKTQAELNKQRQKIELAAAKAQGAAAIKQAGLQNIFGGLTDIASSFAYGGEGDSDYVRAGANIPGISPREDVGTLPRTRVGLGTSAARVSPRGTPSSARPFGMLARPYINPPYVPRRSSPSLFPTYPF